MIRLEEVVQLKEGEEVRAVTRRHVVTLLPLLFLAALLIIVPFFFLFPLFSSGPAGILLFGVLVLVGAIIAIRGFILWDGDLLIVTNYRLIDVDQQGVFARIINEIAYMNIQDPAWSKKSPVDFLFGIGTISASSGSLTITAKHVPHPRELHALITDCSRQFLMDAGWIAAPGGGGRPPSAPMAQASGKKADLVDRVSKQIANMDEEALRKLSSTLKGNQQDIAIAKLFGDKKTDLKEIKEP